MASSLITVSIDVPLALQETFTQFLHAYTQARDNPPDHPDDVERLERCLCEHANATAAQMIQDVLQHAVDRRPTRFAQRLLLHTARRRLQPLGQALKNQGRRQVRLRLGCGQTICLKVPYFSRNCDAQAHRGHKGCYPALQALGLYDHVSPRVASLCAQAVALAGSFQEAQQQLRQHGLVLNLKTLRQIAYRFAARARAALCRQGYRLATCNSVVGLKVVIGLDGGRTRLRQDNGKKTKKGRRGFDNPWREPKLLIIYAVDDEGRKLKTFPPIIDGTFGDANALLRQLEGYLRGLHITSAKQVSFTGDGADWIWNRVGKLSKKLGLRRDQVHEVVDYYHAVEHVTKVLESKKKHWREGQKKWWRGRLLGLLRRGQIEELVKQVRGLKGKVACAEARYFAKRASRMQYGVVQKAGLPIGSGAIESTIRRVVNLRLKGPSLYWKVEHAEAMLLLRSYAKSGRWENLKALANDTGALAVGTACAKALKTQHLRTKREKP